MNIGPLYASMREQTKQQVPLMVIKKTGIVKIECLFVSKGSDLEEGESW